MHLLRAGSDKCFAHEHEIALERHRVGVSSGDIHGAASIPRGNQLTRGDDPRGHEGELEPQWLIFVSAPVRFPDIRECDAIDVDGLHQRLRRLSESCRNRDPTREIFECRMIATEDDVTRATDRCDGDLRRNEWIPVAIASYPVA